MILAGAAAVAVTSGEGTAAGGWWVEGVNNVVIISVHNTEPSSQYRTAPSLTRRVFALVGDKLSGVRSNR